MTTSVMLMDKLLFRVLLQGDEIKPFKWLRNDKLNYNMTALGCLEMYQMKGLSLIIRKIVFKRFFQSTVF